MPIKTNEDLKNSHVGEHNTNSPTVRVAKERNLYSP